MSDPAAAWLRYQIKAGEVALALRHAGRGWRDIGEQLRLGDASDARR